jgi:DNA-binding response OmpR family regulator
MKSNNARVLVADSDERVRSAVFRALLERDVFCDCVSSGGDAIVRLTEQPYVLVILDFSLPHASAIAVIESLRAMSGEARPIVIATGDIDASADSDLVQMVFRRPLRVRDLADVAEACVYQVCTA